MKHFDYTTAKLGSKPTGNKPNGGIYPIVICPVCGKHGQKRPGLACEEYLHTGKDYGFAISYGEHCHISLKGEKQMELGQRFEQDGQTWEVVRVDSPTVYHASKVNADGKRQKGRPRRFVADAAPEVVKPEQAPETQEKQFELPF